MSISLYMDENVPIQITDGWRLRNVDVLTVQEDRLASFPDPAVIAIISAWTAKTPIGVSLSTVNC